MKKLTGKFTHKLFKQHAWKVVKDSTVDKVVQNNRLHFVNETTGKAICGAKFEVDELLSADIYVACQACRTKYSIVKPKATRPLNKKIVYGSERK